MAEATTQRLLHLLEEEHAAITSGAFEGLVDIGPRKEALFATLNDTQVTEALGIKLGKAVRRNQVLLEAAMRGMQAAAGALDTRQTAAQGSVVYGSDGKVSRLSHGDQRLSQKL